MMDEFNSEKRKWDREVDAEAAQLIRNGYPPHQAMEQAVRNVSTRRKIESGEWEPYEQVWF